MKPLIAIILILNIFSGYIAKASVIVKASYHKEVTPINICDVIESKDCQNQVSKHCSSGCSTNQYVVPSPITHIQFDLLARTQAEHQSNLSPIDWTFDLLRPPISA